MLAVVCFDLLTKAVHPDDSQYDTPWTVILVVGCTLVGYLVCFFFNHIIDERVDKKKSKNKNIRK